MKHINIFQLDDTVTLNQNIVYKFDYSTVKNN